MKVRSKVMHRVPEEAVTRLKPNKLGRYNHLIPQYIRELQHKHPRLMSDYFLGSSRINLQLKAIKVHEKVEKDPDTTYSCQMGKVGFSIDRTLLTEVLECYYGGNIPGSGDATPESHSELRMRNRLGIELTELFSRALLGGDSFGGLSVFDQTYEEIDWEYVAEFQFESHFSERTASIFIYLNSELADEMTSRISNPPAAPSGTATVQQLRHLPVRLNCVLARAQVPLDQIIDLKENDVLMIRWSERCDVEINRQKLFSGSIFESDGALFLTYLESQSCHD